MNSEDLKLMKSTVTILIQAMTKNVRPTKKQVEDFDNLYHRLKKQIQ